jgi:hypothetical protein
MSARHLVSAPHPSPAVVDHQARAVRHREHVGAAIVVHVGDRESSAFGLCGLSTSLTRTIEDSRNRPAAMSRRRTVHANLPRDDSMSRRTRPQREAIGIEGHDPVY